jgi:hypothetical protein
MEISLTLTFPNLFRWFLFVPCMQSNEKALFPAFSTCNLMPREVGHCNDHKNIHTTSTCVNRSQMEKAENEALLAELMNSYKKCITIYRRRSGWLSIPSLKLSIRESGTPRNCCSSCWNCYNIRRHQKTTIFTFVVHVCNRFSHCRWCPKAIDGVYFKQKQRAETLQCWLRFNWL